MTPTRVELLPRRRIVPVVPLASSTYLKNLVYLRFYIAIRSFGDVKLNSSGIQQREQSTMTKYIAYHRVSTQKQGASGLGLEAQQAAVQALAGENVLESFVEVESGKRSDNRPQLSLAIEACKRRKATLIVAKLDRLARNVAFISTLMESGVDFVAADNPHATRLTVHILAAVAEDEARRISDRTKAALAAAKRRGVKLGNRSNLTTTAARKGNRANRAAAESHNEPIRAAAAKLRNKGYSLTAIAETLTGRGMLTRRGKSWSPTAVMRLLA